MKIKNVLDYKTNRELHVHIVDEEFGVLTGLLCDGDEFYYPATLVEVAPGIWRS